MWVGLLTDRINNKLERSNLINEHALNRQPVPLAKGPVHTHPYSFENATFFLLFQKKSRPLLPFPHRFRPPTRIRWLTRLRMLDAYVFAIMSPRNNKLAPSLNFFCMGLYSCCDVLQSQQSQTKERSSLPPLHTGSESNLIIGSAASWNNQLEELTKLNLLENKQLG